MTKAGELRIKSMVIGVKKTVENGGTAMFLDSEVDGVSSVSWMLWRLS